MAGILPEGGIAATANNGGLLNADVKEGCQSLFYAISCNRSTFDPIAMNHLLSEVLNVINAAGDEYDCTVKDNLINAITKLASLCAKPNATPDLADYIAGCFDGVDGKVTIQSIIDLVPDACSLNTVASHDEDDFVVGCFNGVTGKRRIGDLFNDCGPHFNISVGQSGSTGTTLASETITNGGATARQLDPNPTGCSVYVIKYQFWRPQSGLPTTVGFEAETASGWVQLFDHTGGFISSNPDNLKSYTFVTDENILIYPNSGISLFAASSGAWTGRTRLTTITGNPSFFRAYKYA